jgi:energy-coupling factor transport system substrate-specific component
MNQNKLKAKDLITTAIFTVVFTLVVFACSMVFGMVVVLYPFFISFIGLFGGTVWLYMRVKVPKPFTITIQCLVCGLLFFIMGTHWTGLVANIIGGILADVITSAGKYKNFKLTVLGYCVWCLCVHIGSFFLVFTARAYYYEYFITSGMDVAWSDAFFKFMSWPLMLGAGVLSVICAVLGMFIGRALLKKHFVKAGIV